MTYFNTIQFKSINSDILPLPQFSEKTIQFIPELSTLVNAPKKLDQINARILTLDNAFSDVENHKKQSLNLLAFACGVIAAVILIALFTNPAGAIIASLFGILALTVICHKTKENASTLLSLQNDDSNYMSPLCYYQMAKKYKTYLEDEKHNQKMEIDNLPRSINPILKSPDVRTQIGVVRHELETKKANLGKNLNYVKNLSHFSDHKFKDMIKEIDDEIKQLDLFTNIKQAVLSSSLS